jgi:hypothetical protein
VPPRLVWNVIFFSLVLAVVIYAVLGYFMFGQHPAPQAPDLGRFRLAFLVVAPLALAICIIWMRRVASRAGSGRGAAGAEPALQAPEAFQRDSVVGMALAETPAVLGFVLLFLGARFADYLLFGAASLAAQFLVVLPAANHYWSEWERRQGGGAGKAIG